MALTPRQDLMVRSQLAVAAKLGPWAKDAGSEGAAYVSATVNPNGSAGLKCENCLFFRAPAGCNIVKGQIDRGGVCRLYVIPQDKMGPKKPEKKVAVSAAPRPRLEGSVG
jgi:hypothetical protein